jgi:hypothetical protein
MCFSLELIKELLIWLVIVVAIIALIRLVLSPLAAQLGPWGGILIQALNIIMWAVVAIAVIVVIFDLIACLLLGLPRIR